MLFRSGVVDPGAGGAEPKDVAGLVARASQLFAQAQDALRAGDFASYGQRIAELDKVLGTLVELTGAATP